MAYSFSEFKKDPINFCRCDSGGPPFLEKNRTWAFNFQSRGLEMPEMKSDILVCILLGVHTFTHFLFHSPK